MSCPICLSICFANRSRFLYRPASLFLAAVVSIATAGSAGAEPAYIYGIHDPGGESNMSSAKGWIVWTEAIGISGSGGVNYSSWSSQGYGVIVRLNNGYGSSGTIPYQSQYAQFASRCANFVQNSSGVDYWIIGNETNLPREWPGNNNGDPNTGEPITVARYVSCYTQCYNAIKAVAPGAKICPSPSGTWSPPWPAQGIEGFVDYWVNCLNGIGASKIDGLILHAYTHGCDPALVTSNQLMGPPYQTIYYHFRVYLNYMSAIPASMNTKPVLITECNQNVECAGGGSPQHTWSNVNSGWVRNIYSEINNWNNANAQKIRCVALFRWPVVPEGQYTFGWSDKSGVIQDFQQAVAFGYQWNTSASPIITRSPSTLSPSTSQGANAASQQFTIQNTGGGTLSYSITDNVSWLSVTPTSGTSTGEVDTITVNYATSSLAVGTYNATITITAGGATNSPQTIAVTLTVTAPCDGLGSGNPSGTNLSLTAAYYIESGRNLTDQTGRQALDGISTTKWCCNTSDTGGTSSLAVDLGSTATVTGYIIRHAQYGGEPSYMNTEQYRVESGTSMFGPWTTEWTANNACQAQYNRFIYGTAKSLRYLRLVITDPGIDTWVRLPEFEIYGAAGSRGTITVYAADYQGGANAAQGTDYNDTTTGNAGGQYRNQNVDIENSTDGRNNVGWIAANEWLNYPIQGQDGGQYTLFVRYATPNTGKSAHFKLNGATLTGTLTFSSTGGWQTWQTLNAGTVSLGSGWKTLQLFCNTDSFNINRFWLEPLTVTPAITRSPSTLAPSCTVGSNAASQTFTVQNTGGGTLNYSISDNVSWLSVTPATGTSTGEVDTITVNYTTSGLAVGTYNGTITISDPAASNNPQTIAVTLTVNSALITVSEDFNSMPAWSSSFDASWGGAAAWSIVSGGQAGTALQAVRSNSGSSAKVRVYSISANSNYTISVWIKCPSSTSYWAECAYKLGSNTAQDFDQNGGTWTMVKKFSDTGTNGNGNVWTQYTLSFNSGSSTQISVGFKLGSSPGNGPTVLWDTLRIN